jgi:hypothetical protein
MRIVSKLLMAVTTAAAVAAVAGTPALADPPSGVTPKPADVVGVGSDTMENVFNQFSHDYNATHSTGQLFSWDATNPATGAFRDLIQLKSGSANCNIPRPDGSDLGILALENTTTRPAATRASTSPGLLVPPRPPTRPTSPSSTWLVTRSPTPPSPAPTPRRT